MAKVFKKDVKKECTDRQLYLITVHCLFKWDLKKKTVFFVSKK